MARKPVPERHHTSSPAAEVQRYFPLRTGYVWTYSEEVLSASRTVLLQRRVTLTVQSHQPQTDEYLAHWDFQSGRTRVPNMRYRVLEDGIQQAQLAGDTTYTSFTYLLKTPLSIGNAWRAIQGAAVRIAAVQQECLVPAGRFVTCVETLQQAVPTPTSRVETRCCFAPDVGLVWQQRRLFQEDAMQRIDTMELQKLPERSLF